MNRNQRIALGITAAVILGMLVFPPFHYTSATGRVTNLGYGLIFDPPGISMSGYGIIPTPTFIAGTVNIPLLLAQWAAVIALGVIAVFIFKDR